METGNDWFVHFITYGLKARVRTRSNDKATFEPYMDVFLGLFSEHSFES